MTTRTTIRDFTMPELRPGEPIDSVQNLADHLWVAARVELSTIPLYLYSAYSIKTKGYSQWAPQRGALRTLIGVAIEEMLHLCLARNLMVAIGRGHDIRFYDKNFIPTYPHNMLNRSPALPLHLKKLSTAHVQTFVDLEAPGEITDVEEYQIHPENVGEYRSLGAFYHSIALGFDRLDRDRKIPWDVQGVYKQYLRGFWNQFGEGKPLRVANLTTARKALNIIIEQGEGSTQDHKHTHHDPNRPDLGDEVFTHWWKFVRIQRDIEGIGAVNGAKDKDLSINSAAAIWPVVDDPTVEKHGKNNPGISSLMTLFNAAYCYMLCILDELYDTPTTDVRKERVPGTKRVEMFSRRYALERNGIAAMQGILYPIAELLVRTPLTQGGDPHQGPNAGPSFQYYEFGHLGNMSKKAELLHLCEKAMTHFPELGGDDTVHRQISLLVDIGAAH